MDDLQLLPLAIADRADPAVAEQLGKAQHRVERVAQFVREVGHEAPLGLGRAMQLIVALRELAVGAGQRAASRDQPREQPQGNAGHEGEAGEQDHAHGRHVTRVGPG